MYLHHNTELFREIIDETSERTGIARSIIEKDYYVTMILKLLARSVLKPVFKGGTSLSKCFHLINRFSEDIDITFSEHLGEARRKKLKYKVLGPIGDELGMSIENWNQIESDKDYNRYIFGYPSLVSPPINGVTSAVLLETALVSYSFPTEEREVGNLIYDVVNEDIPDLVTDYGLSPFVMTVQSVSRTFIDKIFALCDYYLEKKSKRYSRHLYDIHMLYPSITIDDTFKELVGQVREHRKRLPICPSARDGVDIKALIGEFLDSNFYRQDYAEKTKGLLSDNITYEQTAATLREIVEKLF